MAEPSTSPRLERVFALIDQANAQDPRQEHREGVAQPRELLYGRRMTAWLERLEPAPSEALSIAVRAQHIRRWESPRASYPEGRAGYLRWRSDLYRFHGDCAAALMAEVGYEPETIERVRELLLKKRLKQNAEAQTLEDVACLVFLEFYFADFAPEHEEEKVISILRKTWGKMSPRGQEAALTIALPPEARRLVEKALAS